MAKHPDAVQIARSYQWGKVARKYEPLMPPQWLLDAYKDGQVNEAQYTEAFQKEVLDRLDREKVVQDLGCNAILLCHEKPPNFCHRHLVAKWLGINEET